MRLTKEHIGVKVTRPGEGESYFIPERLDRDFVYGVMRTKLSHYSDSWYLSGTDWELYQEPEKAPKDYSLTEAFQSGKRFRLNQNDVLGEWLEVKNGVLYYSGADECDDHVPINASRLLGRYVIEKPAVLITEDSFDQAWQDADNNENESFKASIKRALGLID